MFNFLKNMFKKKIECMDIRSEELDSWYNNNIMSKIDYRRLFGDRLSELKETLNEIKTNADTLDDAEIKDSEKIESKVRSVVSGHKSNYTRLLKQLVNNIDIPESVDHNNIIDFCSDTAEQLNDFGKKTTKSYYATQHLFSDQLKPIVNDIKKIDQIISSIKNDIDKMNIELIEKTKHKIKEIKINMNKIEIFEKDIKKEKEKLDRLNESKKEMQESINKMLESEDYKRLNQDNEELNIIEEKVTKNKNNVLELFSPIESALKKFKRITLEDENIVEQYYADAFEALLDDKLMKILNLLDNMKKNILSDSIELRDMKRKKALETIDNITKDRLNGFLEKYNALIKQKENIQKRIKNNDSDSILKDLRYKLEHFSSMINNSKEKIEQTEKKKSELDIEKIRSDIIYNVKKISGIELKILYP